MQFKIGDKVRLITKEPHHGLGDVTPIKDIGTIEKIVETGHKEEYRKIMLKINFPTHKWGLWNGYSNEVMPAFANNEQALSLLSRGEW